MKRQSILVMVIVTILTANATTFAELSDGLIANYSFSGNANDMSGNEHDGIVYSAILTTDCFGNPDSDYSFS